MSRDSMTLTLTQPQADPVATTGKPGKTVVKVLVWDLDNTLWDGTLLEGDEVQLRPGVLEALQTLDRRGILHSIASRNEPGPALDRLARLGVADYFLYPQIGWGSKSQAVEAIAKAINVGLDAVAFIDDQPFERGEVAHVHPQVLTLDALQVGELPSLPELMPRFVTDESAIRRQMYQADIRRNRAEEEFAGASEEFLASLGMVFTLGPAHEEDLQRAEELTVRTNQLNTTGYTYSYEELAAFRRSPNHLLLVASLTDRFGAYGKIGLALVEKGREAWRLKLLLMSCRVMSRGVGTILLNHLLTRARDAGARFLAELKDTGRNRMMLVTFKFGGFREVEQGADGVPEGVKVLEHPLTGIQPPPEYVEVRVEE
jgi:FkbH-like protein